MVSSWVSDFTHNTTFAGASKLTNANIGLAFAQVGLCHSTIKCHLFFFTSNLSTGYENLAKIEVAKHFGNRLNKTFELTVNYLCFLYFCHNRTLITFLG